MNQPAKAKRTSKAAVLICLSIIATAIFVGVGMYTWQHQKLQDTREDLQDQIDVLEKGIEDMKKKQD